MDPSGTPRFVLLRLLGVILGVAANWLIFAWARWRSPGPGSEVIPE
jgi:hypothetical protein